MATQLWLFRLPCPLSSVCRLIGSFGPNMNPFSGETHCVREEVHTVVSARVQDQLPGFNLFFCLLLSLQL